MRFFVRKRLQFQMVPDKFHTRYESAKTAVGYLLLSDALKAKVYRAAKRNVAPCFWHASSQGVDEALDVFPDESSSRSKHEPFEPSRSI
jgi:hypothetical protein